MFGYLEGPLSEKRPPAGAASRPRADAPMFIADEVDTVFARIALELFARTGTISFVANGTAARTGRFLREL